MRPTDFDDYVPPFHREARPTTLAAYLEDEWTPGDALSLRAVHAEVAMVVSDALVLRWRTRSQGETVVDGRMRDGFADSVVVRTQLAGCGEWTGAAPPGQFRAFRPDSVEVYLHLTALDTAYTRSREGRGDAVREKNASVGITGAYGLFVGMASARRRIVFVLPGA